MTITAAPGAPLAGGVDRRPKTANAGVVGAAIAGGGVAAVVGSDGSPLWATARAVIVAAVTFLTLQAASRPVTRRRGLGELLFGTASMVVGAGIAVPHLSKVGVGSFRSVAGVAALVGGLVATVAGARRVVASGRRRSGWRRVASVGGIVLGVVFALYVGAIPVAVVNVPRTGLDGRAPSDVGLAESAWQTVELTTADGVRLAGWWVPPPSSGADGAAVVLRHGAGSTRASTLRQAAVLAGHGYGVLAVDARGHGESGGRAMDFGWFGDLDTSAAVGFLAAQPGVDPARIGAVGLSMGGEEVIGASAADARIKAVVAEGATGRFAGDKTWFADEHGWRGWVQVQIERLQTALTDVLTSASPPVSLSSAVGRPDAPPTLLIAAGTVPDEVAVAGRLASENPAAVSTWVVPGAGHTAGLATEPDEWERRVVAFLDSALAAR